MYNHTTGPWMIIRDFYGVASIGQSQFNIVATIDQYSDNSEANAMLIAAAPDLLEALQKLLVISEHDYTVNDLTHPYIISARTAITKATTK